MWTDSRLRPHLKAVFGFSENILWQNDAMCYSKSLNFLATTYLTLYFLSYCRNSDFNSCLCPFVHLPYVFEGTELKLCFLNLFLVTRCVMELFSYWVKLLTSSHVVPTSNICWDIYYLEWCYSWIFPVCPNTCGGSILK